MFKELFRKEKPALANKNHVLICALLIHAAKMDENYTDNEKIIIQKAMRQLFNIDNTELEKIINLAETKEKEANQIIEFTKEVKNKDLSFRLKVIEILWKIIYSDGIADMYETTLMRRICGLLYISDKDSGELKKKIKN